MSNGGCSVIMKDKRKMIYKLSFDEFRRFCEEHEFEKCTYSHTNQDNYGRNFCIGYAVSFSHVMFSLAPNRIVFYNDRNDDRSYRDTYVSFSLIDHVEVEDIGGDGGFFDVTIVCGKTDITSSNRYRYNVIFQKKIT